MRTSLLTQRQKSTTFGGCQDNLRRLRTYLTSLRKIGVILISQEEGGYFRLSFFKSRFSSAKNWTYG